MKKALLVFLIAVAPLCIFAQLPSYLPTDGLVGWWPFNGNANDESGNGNDLQNNGVSFSVDRFGNTNSALIFGSQAAPFPNRLQKNTPNTSGANFTYSLWVKRNSNSDDGSFLGESSNNSGGDFSTTYLIPQYICQGVQGNVTGSSYVLEVNIWYHLVITKNANAFTIYVNGIQNSLGNSGFAAFNGTTVFYVTGNDCQMDDIGVWNRALTQQEITDLYTVVPNDNNSGNTSTSTVPAAIAYQAVARDAQGEPLSEADIQVKFTLIADSLAGAAEYSETHSLTTNALGLFTTAFGAGTPLSGTFAGINWSAGNKYLKVELDGGSGFADMGTQQLLSVPYSMRSNTSAKAGTIENAGLPVYANNAAALAGGLVAGQMYRTATGDLKIVY